MDSSLEKASTQAAEETSNTVNKASSNSCKVRHSPVLNRVIFPGTNGFIVLQDAVRVASSTLVACHFNNAERSRPRILDI